MEKVLNGFDLYEKLMKLLPGRNILVISLMMIVIAIGAYFRWIRKLHVRNKFPILVSIFIIIIAFNIFYSSYLTKFLWLRVLITTFMAIFTVGLFYSVKHPLLLSAIRLMKCRKIIDKREVLETSKIKLFNKRPWYMFTTIEQFNFGKLCYQYFFYKNEYGNAYRSINDVNENKLFSDERKKLYLMYMNIYIQLGAVRKADFIYNRINAIEKDTECFLAKSIVEEYKGDMAAASQYLQKALDSKIETTPLQVQAKLFNNIGRMRKLENNLTEAEFYYQKCLQISSLKVEKGIRHIAYQNLIATFYSDDSNPKGKTKALKYFDEYVKEFDGATVYDLFEIENFKLMFYRQFYTQNEVVKIIQEGFKRLKEKVIKESPEVLCYILVSTFRLYTDNRMDPRLVMQDLRDNWEKFFKIKMPDRYFFLKEIHIGMKMFNPNSFGYEYIKEFREVEEYMTNQAFDDLTEALNKTTECEINLRVKLMKERAVCVKDFINPYKFNHVYHLLNEVVNIYELNGLITEAALVRLDIADECFSINNIDNGKIIHADVMNQQVNIVIQQLNTFKKHIVVPEIEIRIAMYCFVLNRKNDSKLYYERFKTHKISPLHFKDWIRNYYATLEREFS